MALQKQLVPLSFAQGIDTKTDKKQMVFGKFAKAENIVFETVNAFSKRKGYDAIKLKNVSNVQIEDCAGLSRFAQELLLISPSTLYTYSNSLERLISRGSLYNITASTQPVAANTATHDQCDVLHLEGMEVFAYHDATNGTVRYSVRDYSSKTFAVANALVASGANKPQVCAIQNVVYILYLKGANLCYRKFSILTPGTLNAEVPIYADAAINSSANLSTVENSNKIFVAYNSTDTDALKCFYVSADGTFSSAVGITSSEATNAIDIYVDTQSRVVISWADATDVYYTVRSFALGVELTAPTSLETIDNVKTVSCIDTGDGTYKFYYTVPGSGSYHNYIKRNTGNLSAVVGTPVVKARSVSMASRLFLQNDLTYALVQHDSVLQSTYFLMDQNGVLSTKILPGNGGPTISGSLPHVARIGANVINTAVQFKSRLDSDNGTFFGVTGIIGAAITFSELAQQSGFLGNNLVFGGGLPQLYDGATVTEHGFNLYPENLSLTASISVEVATTVEGETGITAEQQTLTFSEEPGSGSYKLKYDSETTAAINWDDSTTEIKTAIEALTGISSTVTVTGDTSTGFTIEYDNSMGDVVEPTVVENTLGSPLTGGVLPDGTYGYIALYKWTDNYGQDHFSAPSPELDVELTGGGTEQQVTIRVPTLRLTAKQNAVIELYRTENAGTIFYKISSNSSPTANDTTVDYVDIVDATVTDEALISREALYNTGGVLENTAPPSATVVAKFGNRIALTGLEDPYAVQFSKIRGEGRPVEFNDTLRRQVNPVSGPNSALGAMSDKLIIFQPTACFYVAGNGPDNLGQADNWNDPELIQDDIGCAEPNSIVLTPLGLMFKSNKGIYLLTPQLQLMYIGKEVEVYNSLSITSAKVVPKQNQVRFTTDSACLVYNYQELKWATFANHEALDAEIIEDSYYYLREDGRLFQQSTEYADNGIPVRMLAETGWISFNGLQGFLRVYKMLILGKFKTAHKLRVQIAFDFNEAFTQDITINTADFMDATPYGGYSPYGEPDTVPYGGDGNVYQLRVDLSRQKCQSIKIRLSDVQTEAGEGLQLSAITFEVGGKGGLFKVSQSKVYGPA